MSSVVTIKAKKKMLKARAGIGAVAPIKYIVLGSGAVNDGIVKVPDENQEELYCEILRKEIESCTPVSETCYRYACILSKEELAGENINEIGIVDSENDLIAMKTFSNKSKDADMEMVFEVDDTF